MKNKKGFIIVMAILAIIMLIGIATYSSIQERMKARAEKTTVGTIESGGEEIGGSEEFPGEAIVENTEIAIGAYVEYIPTGSSVEIDGDKSGTGEKQTFTPSETTRWRVLRNNNGQLDIISAGSAGVLSLKGQAGYANSVGILKIICSRYTDGGKYATKALPLGYTDGVDTITGEIKYSTVSSKIDASDNFWNAYYDGYDETAKSYISSNLTPYMDAGWLDFRNKDEDMRALGKIGARDAWLASRNVIINDLYAYFRVDSLGSDSIVYNNHLYLAYSDGSDYSSNYSFGVCPIVSLKAGIKFLYGDGTLNNPYRMNEEVPEWAGEVDTWL